VANGRAKFESTKISPEKPMRFFSRSRPGTPLLPAFVFSELKSLPQMINYVEKKIFLFLVYSNDNFCIKVPAPPEPITPGPVKKKSNSYCSEELIQNSPNTPEVGAKELKYTKFY